MGAILDNYKLYRFGRSGNHDFTELVDAFSWSSDIDTLGSQLSFGLATVPGQPTIYAGDILSLTNNGAELFRGVVADDDGSRAAKSITAYDFAWYLNESSVPVQFKKARADNAIKQLCTKAGVPAGAIASMATPITKIYKTEKVADAIRDIIAQHEKAVGVKMRMEMLTGKLTIYKWGDIIISPQYTLAANVAPVKVTDAYGDGWNLKRSLSGMINSVVAIQGGKYITVQDTQSVGAYGLLQEVIEIDAGQNPRTQAQNLLNEKNVIPEDLTLPLLGDDSMIAGRILTLPAEISGNWLIKSAAHDVAANIHTCNVTLKRLVA